MTNESAESTVFRRVDLSGLVQGVGFRPFIHRLALRFGIRGTVYNTTDGVVIFAAAESTSYRKFIEAIRLEAPPRALHLIHLQLYI